jgi:exosortase
MTTLPTRCLGFGELTATAKTNVVGLCAAIAAAAWALGPLWFHDDNLTHGIFLPFMAVLLLAESRRDPSPRFLGPGAGPATLCALVALASLASFAVAVAYAAALGWTYSMADFMLSVALVLALGAGLLGFADARVRFVPVNWASGVAVALWLFAGPPPPGTFARLAFFLQTKVTSLVVWLLGSAGIAAYQNGNVIELAHASVGVSEACSGVRSLISCTVAGLFVSAVLVRRPSHRALVILLSPGIGLVMNFVRSLLLTLLVNAGVTIEGRWHDLTGASIIAVTTALVAGLAWALRRRELARAKVPRGQALVIPAGRSPLQGILAVALVVAVAMVGFVGARRQVSPATLAREPDLAALLPAAPPGWTAQASSDLERYSDVLQTRTLVERVYSDGPSAENAHVTLYLAYWKPGQAPVSLVDEHTPDACWPGTGWVAEPLPVGHAALAVDGRTLAPAECRIFALNGFKTRVWFWHLYGGRPLAYIDPYSPTRILGLAWRYGFARPEDQLFVRISSNRPWEEIASQPTLRQFLSNLRPLGL